MCTINKVHLKKKKNGAFHGFIDTMGYKTQMNTCWQHGIKGNLECKSMALLRKGKFIGYSNFTRGGLLVKFE